MDKVTRRRFLLDLASIGGIIALAAGHGAQARPVPADELKRKMDKAIDKAFEKKDPPPRRPDPPPQRPMPGRVSHPPYYPPAGGLRPPPRP